MDHKQALQLAYEVSSETFTEAKLLSEIGPVQIFNYSRVKKGAEAVINTRVVREEGGGGRTGITFHIVTRASNRGSPASSPGYVADMFISALAKRRQQMEIETARFEKYTILKDSAVADTIGDSIPSTYQGFVQYLDGKKDLRKFEGIWTDPDGNYTLGMIYDPRDPRHKYKAFVIESRRQNWNPGEIKLKLNDLAENGVAIGPYRYGNKADLAITWAVQPGLLTALTDKKLVLFMIYPDAYGGESTEGEISGVGTGWAVSADGHFVTNAHVVEGAKKIYVGFREGNPKRARVVAIDSRIDLAVLKIAKPDRRYTPMPLSIARAVPNGTAITVIGYPLAFTLGDDPRVTDGIISAQSGYEKDVTRYQISAPIQPGNSGGPVVGPDGRVAAVVVSGLRGNTQNVNFAIKMAYLRTLLDGAGVGYNTAANASMSPAQIFQAYRGSILPVWTER